MGALAPSHKSKTSQKSPASSGAEGAQDGATPGFQSLTEGPGDVALGEEVAQSTLRLGFAPGKKKEIFADSHGWRFGWLDYVGFRLVQCVAGVSQKPSNWWAQPRWLNIVKKYPVANPHTFSATPRPRLVPAFIPVASHPTYLEDYFSGVLFFSRGGGMMSQNRWK